MSCRLYNLHMEKLIEIKKVSKSFGRKTVILKDLNLDIYKGERLIIVGPNGSGKSTLVNIITDVVKPTSGKVEYIGYNQRQDFISNLGVQFQNSALPSGYSVKEVIDLMFQVNYDSQRWPDKSVWEKEINGAWKEQLIETFRMSKLLKRRVQKLSGGQKQSLNILLSFAAKPQFLILDEVTTGLDIKAQEEFLRFIKEYVTKEKATLIVVSHILKEIHALGERLVILDDKKIVADKTMKEIGKTADKIDKFMHAYFVDGVVK